MMSLLPLLGMAQTSHNCCNDSVQTTQDPRFSIKEFNGFRLHSFVPQGQGADPSYIIEGVDSLITLEQPLMRANGEAYDLYIARLNKPVAKRTADFHLGNTGDATLTTPEGMPEAFNGEQYQEMMSRFAKQYGDAMVALPTGKMETVPFDSALNFAGITFTFLHASTNDFPGADILIGHEVVYSHFTPSKAHIRARSLSDKDGVQSRIDELKRVKNTGASWFIGGHGAPVAVDMIEFELAYLKKTQELLKTQPDAKTFANALISAYPDLAGTDNVPALAELLYSTNK